MQTTSHQYQKTVQHTPMTIGAYRIPAKLRENTAMRFGVTVQKLKVTGQTEGRFNISHPGPSARREIKITTS